MAIEFAVAEFGGIEKERMISPPNRRWFQFSTRGLLLLLTAVCGWLGYLTEAARRQRDAVAALVPVATIGYDDGSFLSGSRRENKTRSGLLGWLESCLGRDYFDRVEAVHLYRGKLAPEHLKAITSLGSTQLLVLTYNESVDDAFVAQLVGLRRLHSLHLNYTCIGDASLQHIALLPRLKLLSIRYTKIDGSGLRFLQASPSLERLSFTNTGVTDNYLGDLGECSRLRYIDLRSTRVTAGGVARLQKALPSCEIRWRD